MLSQMSISTSIRLGVEKVQPLISFGYQTEKKTHFSISFNYGQFLNHNYNICFNRNSSGSYTFLDDSRPNLPYQGQYPGVLVIAKTKTESKGVGLAYAKQFKLRKNTNDVFYVETDFTFFSLSDKYIITKRNGADQDYQHTGLFRYHATGLSLRTGYRFNFESFFIGTDIGLSYYYPIYILDANKNISQRYSANSPFAGVEYELNIGIGYKL
jgi:hypothetical protein